MGVPHSNNPRITPYKQQTTRLLPTRNNPSTIPHPNDLVQSAERTDHLYGSATYGGVIIPIESYNTVRCKKHSVDASRGEAFEEISPDPVKMMPPTS